MPLERLAVTGIVPGDIHRAEVAKIFDSNGRGRWDEATIRRDNEHAGHPECRPREDVCVGEFSTKIEAAQKSKHFAEGRTVLAPQSPREFKLRPIAHDHAGALTTCVSGRQEKNAALPRVKLSCHY